MSFAAPEVARRVEAWFGLNARDLPWRSSYDPWHVWVSEVMLQQTRMDVVLPYFARFIERFPTPDALSSSDEQEVLSLWSGLGYYRRARMLRQGAQGVVSRHGGRVPDDVEALRALPGVGQYTAGAIASIAFDRRAAVVDGNVERLLARIARIDDPLGSGGLRRQAWALSTALVNAARSPRDLNQGLMELGARVCRPRTPDCRNCPLVSSCGAAQAGTPSLWPRPRVRPEVERLEIPLLVLTDEGGRILLLRNDGSLMSGMFHLPHGNARLIAGLDRSGLLRPTRLIHTITHTITNRRISFQVYEAEVREGDGATIREGSEALWIHPEELSTVPHPSYVRKALRA